jgi:hypothetical protein
LLLEAERGFRGLDEEWIRLGNGGPHSRDARDVIANADVNITDRTEGFVAKCDIEMITGDRYP